MNEDLVNTKQGVIYNFCSNYFTRQTTYVSIVGFGQQARCPNQILVFQKRTIPFNHLFSPILKVSQF